MKIALVHDFLCAVGGSERIFEYLCEEFKEADIFTLSINPVKTFPYFSTREINVTWMNRFVRSHSIFKWFFPIASYAMEKLDLSGYQIVISSSATVAKYIKVPSGKHFCYCYFPTRALWESGKYFGNSRKKVLLKPFLKYLQKRDFSAAQQVDQFIAISEYTRRFIKKYYNRNSVVIHSPIETDKFYSAEQRGDYYLLVSRLEKWKRVDYAITAFNKLGLPLRIIGTGEEQEYLKRISKANITFMGSVNDRSLAEQYSRAKAVIFTPFLEYGLVPLEANASGAPVIGYGRGGITETMMDVGGNGRGPKKKATAIFFYEQTDKALMKAVLDFKKYKFFSSKLVKHAKNWDVGKFRSKIRKYIMDNAP